MPRLVPGGKWVYGWVTIGPARELTIPPAAWDEYRLRVGDEVLFLQGSRRSGGFGITHGRLMPGMAHRLHMQPIARAPMDQLGQVVVPAVIPVQAGDRLLAVRGSGRALGFVARGPIYEEALEHPELTLFGPEAVP